MRESYRFVVTGRVQGVWFRQSTKKRAEDLGLDGWVRNRTDGAVEGLVAGDDPSRLAAFRDFLKEGPAAAKVERVAWEASPDPAPQGFEVRP